MAVKLKIRTVELVRSCLISSEILFFICGAIIVGLGWMLWANRAMAVFGDMMYNSVAIAFIVMGCVLMVWSFFGWCTYGRVDGWCNSCMRHGTNKYMVAFHAPVSFVIFVILVAVAVFFLVLSAQIASGDQYWVDKMDQAYRDAVQARPSVVCRMMTDYGCAGFRAPCEKGVLGDGNKYCPDYCVKQAISKGGSNIPLFSRENPVCYPRIHADLVSTMNITGGFTIAAGGAICLALFFVCFHFYFRDEDRTLVYDEHDIADLRARLDTDSKPPSAPPPRAAAHRPEASPGPGPGPSGSPAGSMGLTGGKRGGGLKLKAGGDAEAGENTGGKTARFREADDV
eukprot:tig00020614_g12198.t1